jgi:hypothetical protein
MAGRQGRSLRQPLHYSLAPIALHIPSHPIPFLAMTATITAEQLAAFTEVSTAELARRLDEDDYPSPFDGLADWHLMRALAIHRPELARPYLHLVDQEPFDED